MERRGDCCIAMCGVATGGAGGDKAEAAWRMGRIMLRYRPIAPKPAASGASPAVGGPSETSRGRRGKRRTSGGGGRGRKAKKLEDHPGRKTTAAAAPAKKGEEVVKSSSPSSPSSTISLSSSTGSTASPLSSSATAATATTLLPLMPEAPEERPDNQERKPAADPAARLSPTPTRYAPPPWFRKGDGAGEAVARPRPVRPAGSWVTVECLTNAWRDGEVVAPDDEALRRALEADACPGFVTDNRDRVTWVSEAYRRMVTGLAASSSPHENDDEDDEQVTVGLVTRGMVPEAGACRAFTCRVRVRYASRRRGKGSLAAPCDVWRLADGGCAWRLDIKAALSLGI